MSTITPVSRKVSAQEKDRGGNAALVLVIICLSNLVLVLTSETFANAVELTGQY